MSVIYNAYIDPFFNHPTVGKYTAHGVSGVGCVAK